MVVGVLDVESSTFKEGHPFSQRNKLCVVGLRVDGVNHQWTIEYDDSPYGSKLKQIQEKLEQIDVLVGVNIKFDINWLSRYGLSIAEKTQVVDLQVVFYLRSNQEHRFPSLEEMAAHHGFPGKSGKIQEYWKQGLNTTDIPLGELLEYNANDLDLEYKVFEKEHPISELALAASQDLLVLAAMEQAGICWDSDYAKSKSVEIDDSISRVTATLVDFADTPGINFGSSDHLSALIYGGNLRYSEREKYTRKLVDGREAEKEHWVEKVVELPGYVNPKEHKIPELKKKGYYSTEEGILRKIKTKGAAKKLIGLLLERRGLMKLKSTYYEGITNRIQDMDWKAPIIHPQYHSCLTATGRLSGSNPNPQNIPEEVRKCIISRF